jgi:hypothetical protein
MGESNSQRVLNVLISPIVIGLYFVVYSVLIRFFIYPRYAYLIEPDATLIQSFIEWFGVAYGLFIALVLVNVWAQYDTTEREFDREADAIFMLYQSVRQVKDKGDPSTLKRKIIGKIKEYVSHVTRNFEREHRRWTIKDAGDNILEDIRDLIGKLVHTREPDSITSELVKEFTQAVDLRGDRISHSKQHIPDPVWLISLASSILWLIPFYGLNFKSNAVALVLVGGVTLIVVAILVIIKDLDDAFEGTWRINISEWEILGDKIELQPTILLVYDLHSSYFSKALAYISHKLDRCPCALYSLVNSGDEKQHFFDSVESLAYTKVYCRDEFEELYDPIGELPAVVCKSNRTMQTILTAEEIKATATLTELMSLIQASLDAFSSPLSSTKRSRQKDSLPESITRSPRPQGRKVG